VLDEEGWGAACITTCMPALLRSAALHQNCWAEQRCTWQPRIRGLLQLPVQDIVCSPHAASAAANSGVHIFGPKPVLQSWEQGRHEGGMQRPAVQRPLAQPGKGC